MTKRRQDAPGAATSRRVDLGAAIAARRAAAAEDERQAGIRAVHAFWAAVGHALGDPNFTEPSVEELDAALQLLELEPGSIAARRAQITSIRDAPGVVDQAIRQLEAARAAIQPAADAVEAAREALAAAERALEDAQHTVEQRVAGLERAEGGLLRARRQVASLRELSCELPGIGDGSILEVGAVVEADPELQAAGERRRWHELHLDNEANRARRQREREQAFREERRASMAAEAAARLAESERLDQQPANLDRARATVAERMPPTLLAAGGQAAPELVEPDDVEDEAEAFDDLENGDVSKVQHDRDQQPGVGEPNEDGEGAVLW